MLTDFEVKFMKQLILHGLFHEFCYHLRLTLHVWWGYWYLSSHQPLPQCLQERCPGLWLSEHSSCPVGTPCPSLARTPLEPQWHSLHYAPGEQGKILVELISITDGVVRNVEGNFLPSAVHVNTKTAGKGGQEVKGVIKHEVLLNQAVLLGIKFCFSSTNDDMLYRLSLDWPKTWPQCEPHYHQMWSGRSDHS